MDRRVPVRRGVLGLVRLELSRDRASNRVDLCIVRVASPVAVELVVLVEQPTRFGVFKAKVCWPVHVRRCPVLGVAPFPRLAPTWEDVDAQTDGEDVVLLEGVPVARKDRKWFAHGAGRGGTPELEVLENGIVVRRVALLRLRGRGV